MKVRIGFGPGVLAPSGDPAFFGPFVDDLERLGFDSLWLSERAAGPLPDPVAAIAFAAGRTRRLKLGTSVMVLPGRNPALLAKQLASLDALSAGRFLPAFGLGVADATEQQAFGVARAGRSPWFEEALPLLRRFWTGEPVFHHGRFDYDGLALAVTPRQQPFSVWLGGAAPGELRRVGRLGDGWLASFCTPESVARDQPVIEQAAADAQREIDPEHFGAMVLYSMTPLDPAFAEMLAGRRPGTKPDEIVPVGVDAIAERLRAFTEVGFSKLVLVPVGAPADWAAQLTDLSALLTLQT